MNKQAAGYFFQYNNTAHTPFAVENKQGWGRGIKQGKNIIAKKNEVALLFFEKNVTHAPTKENDGYTHTRFFLSQLLYY